MDRDLGQEMDVLKREITDIKELLQAFMGAQQGEIKRSVHPKTVGNIEKIPFMHPDPAIRQIFDRLENICGAHGNTGRLSYVGVFASEGRQRDWIRHEVNVDDLLALIENKTAGKVLKSIGNNDRLNILLAILKRPMTVNHIIEQCGFNTTGQVYHHLKPLLAADLIADEGNGVYAVVPHRVQGIIMLLAGISDMVDPLYTQGSWSEE